MPDAFAMLAAEHRVIARLLGSLEKLADAIMTDPRIERETVRDFASFFRNYVDTLHHGKEERMFARLPAHGFPKDSGPVPALLSEHNEGREHLDALEAIGNGFGPLTSGERQLVQGHALGYVMRLGTHIQREDRVLFPMIAGRLPGVVLSEIQAEFQQYDRSLEASGLLSSTLGLAEKVSGLDH